MQLTTTQTGDVLVVKIEEPRLDKKTHVLFRKKLAAHFRPGVKIALGLGKVSYADGPGYGAMLTLHREAVALGGDIKIFSLNNPVRTVFQKLRLHRRMETFNLEEEAVRAFARPFPH